jgi:hypothetical protein
VSKSKFELYEQMTTVPTSVDQEKKNIHRARMKSACTCATTKSSSPECYERQLLSS